MNHDRPVVFLVNHGQNVVRVRVDAVHFALERDGFVFVNLRGSAVEGVEVRRASQTLHGGFTDVPDCKVRVQRHGELERFRTGVPHGQTRVHLVPVEPRFEGGDEIVRPQRFRGVGRDEPHRDVSAVLVAVGRRVHELPLLVPREAVLLRERAEVGELGEAQGYAPADGLGGLEHRLRREEDYVLASRVAPRRDVRAVPVHLGGAPGGAAQARARQVTLQRAKSGGRHGRPRKREVNTTKARSRSVVQSTRRSDKYQ